MKIKSFELTNLKEFYKHVYKCEKCNVKYGSDVDEPKRKECPLCERPNFRYVPKKRKKEI